MSRWDPGHASYGYENYRENGRGLIRVEEREADNVRRIFELYAYHNHTLEMVVDTMAAEGRYYRKHRASFKLSKVHQILNDRAYLGEIGFHGEWHPGKHKPIIDRSVFDRVQTLLGKRTYFRYDSVYGHNLIACGHCEHPILCEIKRKKSGREYRYYRCSQYNAPGHPKDRAKESDFDKVVLAAFETLRIDDPYVRKWLEEVIRSKSQSQVEQTRSDRKLTREELNKAQKERDALLDMMLKGHIEADMYKRKDKELLSLITHLQIILDGRTRAQTEIGDTAMKLLELSQTLKSKWLAADIPEKRALLEILCLNLTYKNANLVITLRKPFDTLAEGLQMKNGTGGWN
ncbi:MAG: recombinase family protein [Planctomycetaceae bacterium]|nr:recombinase family protein [Planctomycetaceae bacterium]